MSKEVASPDVLRKILRYEPHTGKLFWLFRNGDMFPDTGYGGAEGAASRWNARFAGKEALIAINARYFRGSIFGQRVSSHRVIWAMQTGSWPTEEIDHINCDGLDNRWVNLREAKREENCWNRRMGKSNKSGFKGVSWDDGLKTWTATIRARLGRFDTPEGAADAYARASAILHGAFGRT